MGLSVNCPVACCWMEIVSSHGAGGLWARAHCCSGGGEWGGGDGGGGAGGGGDGGGEGAMANEAAAKGAAGTGAAETEAAATEAAPRRLGLTRTAEAGHRTSEGCRRVAGQPVPGTWGQSQCGAPGGSPLTLSPAQAGARVHSAARGARDQWEAVRSLAWGRAPGHSRQLEPARDESALSQCLL